MSNVISLDFHRLQRSKKAEFIAMKNNYFKMDVLQRAQQRLHVERQLALASTRFVQAYFTLLQKAYNEVDENV